jgi:arylsulfatase A-like enzyme
MRCFILTLLACCSALSAGQGPNIVMVLIDDMGWGDLACFGNTEVKTPVLDGLAAEGLRFTQFYVNSPICSPSRCALTTGQYPQRWRISSYLNNRADNERRGVAQWLDLQAPTLARTMKAGGYATGHFGKWHLGGQRDVDDAPAIREYGFDESLTNFEGMGAKLLPLTLRPGAGETAGKIWEDAERLGGPVRWVQRSEMTGAYVDAALSFMRGAVAEKRPFFVNLWPDDVHSPWWPPVEKWGPTKKEMYHAVLMEMDKQLGRLMDYLRSSAELRDNTVLLFCSDNGPEPGAGSAGPFRGTKATLYEGGLRSPLMVWAPGLMGGARGCNDGSVCAAMDLVPSVLALAGLRPGTELDGENMAEVLLGRSGASRAKPLFWRRPPDRKTATAKLVELLPDLAMRDGRWKLLCDFDGSLPQLYDLAEDAGERKNLASAEPERVREMTGRLLEWHGGMPPDGGPALGNEVKERLGE